MNRWERRVRRILIVMAMLAVLASGATWVFCHVGQWLVVQDQLEPAQAIVVLSGGMPLRAREAAKIYHQGFAAQVWVTRPVGPADGHLLSRRRVLQPEDSDSPGSPKPARRTPDGRSSP